MLWGEDVTQAFLKHNGLTQVVRSHEVPEDLEGTCLFHSGTVITVFSASNYAGAGANKGAVLQVALCPPPHPHKRTPEKYWNGRTLKEEGGTPPLTPPPPRPK